LAERAKLALKRCAFVQTPRLTA